MSRKALKDLGSRQYNKRLRSIINFDNDIHPENLEDEPMLIDEDTPPSNAELELLRRISIDNRSVEPEEIGNIEEIYAILTGNNDDIGEEHLLVGEMLEANELLDTNDTTEEGSVFAIVDDNDDEEEDYNGEDEIPNNETDDNSSNTPLYLSAEITVEESMLAILSMCLKHHLTKSCVSDLISTIEMHCPSTELVKNSLYKFQKFFNFGEVTYKKHYYCSSCTNKLNSEYEVCATCSNSKSSDFIEMPIISQIRMMYQREDFFNLLQRRFQLPNEKNTVCDIYDGKLYQEWVNNGFLSNKNNISFSWYTDGIPVFSSSKISAWPIYLTINELPFEDRKKRHNTLILGLWYGEKKPDFNLFFYSFRSTFQTLLKGIRVTLPDERTITVKSVLLMGVCDLPAKSECLNFKQFNGEYGCPVCFDTGDRLQIGQRSYLQIYPYNNNHELRTSDKCLAYARIATKNNPQFGVKGHTALSRIMPDFVRGINTDRMHAVDGGVMKKILHLLFDKSFKSYSFSLYTKIDEANNRLKMIKTTKFIHRMPRNINDLVHWKASELKHFLFYYSLPIFEGIMDLKYFNHFTLLVVGVSILSSEKITHIMIDVAEDLLNRFLAEFEHLYDLKYLTINFHLLGHLAHCVREHGPLWSYTCYEYENMNGEILNLIHGTGDIHSQVAESHNQLIRMINYTERINNESVKKFCLEKKKQVKITQEIDKSTYSVGNYTSLDKIPDVIKKALSNRQMPFDNVHIVQFARCLKNNKLYISEIYTRSSETNSVAAKYIDSDMYKMGFIYCFIKYLYCQCNKQNCICDYEYLAIIREVRSVAVYNAQGSKFSYNTSGFIHKCEETLVIKAIVIKNLISPCIQINIDKNMYLISPVNTKEVE